MAKINSESARKESILGSKKENSAGAGGLEKEHRVVSPQSSQTNSIRSWSI